MAREYTATEKAWKWHWWEKDYGLSVGGEYQLDVTGHDDSKPLFYFQIPIIIDEICEISLAFTELDTKQKKTVVASHELIIKPRKTDKEKHLDRIAAMMFYAVHGYEPLRSDPESLVIHDWLVFQDLATAGFEPTIEKYQQLDIVIRKN